MIPDIAIMIFAFGVSAMLYIITRQDGKPTPKFVQFVAILTIIVAGICIADIIEQGNQAAKSMEEAQRSLQNMQRP